jgi:hypothetical protein
MSSPQVDDWVALNERSEGQCTPRSGAETVVGWSAGWVLRQHLQGAVADQWEDHPVVGAGWQAAVANFDEALG